MGEFDLSLIREFRSRPAFYDRNSPRFKDKLYTAHEWQEISNKLGYDVSLLKDRMLQLRNRYNIEKRRLEQFRDENPGVTLDSPWPLYEELHFLSDHIRARRSYKRMLPLHMTMANASSNSLHSNDDIPFPNGLLTVKVEEGEQADNENDSEEAESGDSRSGSENINNGNHTLLTAQPIMLNHSTPFSNPPGIRVRNTPSLMPPPPLPPTLSQGPPPNTVTANPLANRLSDSIATMRKNHRISTENNDIRPPKRSFSQADSYMQKYVAFGDFVSSSLYELPPHTAFRLVEKFTSELVTVLMKKHKMTEEEEPNNTSYASLNGQVK